MLEKIADIVIKNLMSEPAGALVVLLVLAGIFKIATIRSFARDLGRQRELDIVEALKIDALGSAERVLLSQELNRLVVKRGLGFSASPAMRRRVAELIEQAEGELEVRTFARAWQFIPPKPGRLTVRITTLGYVEHVAYWIISILSFVAGAAIFATSTAVLSELQLRQGFGLAALVLALFLIAALFLYGTLPLTAARRLRPIVDRLQAAPPLGSEHS